MGTALSKSTKFTKLPFFPAKHQHFFHCWTKKVHRWQNKYYLFFLNL